MSTQPEVAATVTKAAAKLTANKAEIATLTAKVAELEAQGSAGAAQLAAVQAQLATATTEKNALLVQVAELQEEVAAGETVIAELEAAVELLKQALGEDAPPPPPPPPTGDDAAILAELKDNTKAGVDKRLGPKAPAGMAIPAVWERPQAVAPDLGWRDGPAYMGKYSAGLSVEQPQPWAAVNNDRPRFDYGSDDMSVGFVPDKEFDPVNLNNIGFARLRPEEHSNGAVQIAPVAPWNSGDVDPDRDSMNHVRYNVKEKLGRVVGIAYGKKNRFDALPGLYDASRGIGFWGMMGTATVEPSWAGTDLPVGFVPTCITVTSMNEFVIVGGHNELTGKGQYGIYWLGSGQDLQGKQNPGKNLPFDWPVTYPGLMNSGKITMTKLFGFFDLPVKFPTNIDCVLSVGANSRIQGPDGNASYLNIWPLSTEAERAAFLGQNDSWISKWGKMVVTSKSEKKAVTIDLTPLIAGVRDQYFGSQEKFNQVVYQNPGSAYGAYNLKDPMVWPWGREAKPEWSPVVVKVIDIPTPNFMVVRPQNEVQFAIVSPDGFLRFYTWEGAANGEIYVGKNPVHLNHDKGTSGVDIQRANSGPLVTCREDRSVVVLDSWGPSAKIILKIQDPQLEDPVAAEALEVHGSESRLIAVVGFNDKAVFTYRGAPYKLSTQGGMSFPIGPGGTGPEPAFERGGVYVLEGHPFCLAAKNVN